MSKIYVGQTDIVIKLTVNKNISGSLQTRIMYENPQGVIGFFNATIENPTLGVLKYLAQNNELNVVGTWTFWAEIILNNGLKVISTPANYKIYNPGT